ncbi:hypothetical protein [Hoylesella nanceiensis]|nr:hypothetical protein [Hoylesella nanceiensis]
MPSLSSILPQRLFLYLTTLYLSNFTSPLISFPTYYNRPTT